MFLLFSILSLLFPQPEATIVFAGDAMQHQRQLDAAQAASSQRGVYDYTACFADIAPWVSAADYAVVNLETTLGGRNYTGYPCFTTPDSYATALRDAGFDLFLNANNHTLDRGADGLRRTLTVLDSLGVDHTGTYVNATARNGQVPLVKDINGFRVAFLNYTFSTNGIPARDGVVVDMIDKQRIAADIAAARQAGAELVTVIPHWGTEYRLLPDSWQRSMADWLLTQDVDLIIGGHPHVIQPMKVVTDPETGRRRLLVYSLGNFISGMRTTDTRGGAMLSVTLTRDAEGKARFDCAQYRLVYVVPPSQKTDNYTVRFIDSDADITRLPAGVQGTARAFTTNALRTFNGNNVSVSRFDADLENK